LREEGPAASAPAASAAAATATATAGGSARDQQFHRRAFHG
jgi:hypothetical protein